MINFTSTPLDITNGTSTVAVHVFVGTDGVHLPRTYNRVHINRPKE